MTNAPNADANDEEIDNDTVIDDSGSFTQVINSLQDEILKNEGMDAVYEVVY